MSNILSTIEREGLILFFKYEDEIYGAGEQERIIFAKLKSKDETAKWRKSVSFLAVNLTKLVKGEKPSHLVVTEKNLNKIKIITDNKELEKLLKK